MQPRRCVTTYNELMDRIAALKAQAQMARALERQQALQDIQDLMDQHGITPADLRQRRKQAG